MSTIVVSDFNLTKVSTKELSDTLDATIQFGGRVFLLARRGSGKTYLSKAAIKRAGFNEVYWNLSTFNRTDVAGFPLLFNPKDQNYVHFLLPHYFKLLMEGDKPCVLLLDEIDKAETELNGPLLELLQDGTINGRKLPNLHSVIMTGNLIAEGGNKPIPPLLDRGEKYLVEVLPDHWLEWAGSKEARIHPSITAFIKDHPDCLYGDVDAGELIADESPRGWHNSSNLLNFGEANGWNNKLLAMKVSGCIGKRSGLKYNVYFEHYQVLLPLVERIMKGETLKDWNKLEPGRQCVAAMLVCSRFARELDRLKTGEFPVITKHIARFLKDIDPEMALMSFRSQVGRERALQTGLINEANFDPLIREWGRQARGVS